MKILFCGLGSIGQRHLRNLLRLEIENLEILAFRKRGLQRTLTDTLTVEAGTVLEEKYNIRAFSSLDKALTEQPDIVFITNPMSLHQETLREVMQKSNAHVFIEKPLGHTLSGWSEILYQAKQKGKAFFMGFQNRFHPCIKQTKELLEGESIGKILAAHIEIGEYMPATRTYEDYRESCAVKKELGGGVILAQIHEIDYAYYFFGVPESVYTIGGKLSHLEIDVEDTADMLLTFKQFESHYPVHIHMDFLQNPPSRTCKIIGTHGKIEFDLLRSTLVCYDGDGNKTIDQVYSNFARNDMFIEELRLFLSICRGESEPVLTLEEGIKSLEIATAAKESMKKRAPILL